MFMLRLEWDVTHKLTPVLEMGTDIDGLSTYPGGGGTQVYNVYTCVTRGFQNTPL